MSLSKLSFQGVHTYAVGYSILFIFSDFLPTFCTNQQLIQTVQDNVTKNTVLVFEVWKSGILSNYSITFDILAEIFLTLLPGKWKQQNVVSIVHRWKFTTWMKTNTDQMTSWLWAQMDCGM